MDSFINSSLYETENHNNITYIYDEIDKCKKEMNNFSIDTVQLEQYKLLNEKKSFYIYITNNIVVFLQTSRKF